MSNDINSEIVNSISSTGGKAIGIAGNVNDLIGATKLNVEVKDSDSNIEKIIDIGFVGKPTNFKSEIIKIATKKNKNVSADTEKIWNNIYNKMTVAREAKLPGILGSFPIPNIVTKRKFIFLSIMI